MTQSKEPQVQRSETWGGNRKSGGRKSAGLNVLCFDLPEGLRPPLLSCRSARAPLLYIIFRGDPNEQSVTLILDVANDMGQGFHRFSANRTACRPPCI